MRRQHPLNPAALGALVLAVALLMSVTVSAQETIRVGGNFRPNLITALNELEEQSNESTDYWLAADSADILIHGHDGGSANMPDYSAHLAAGKHVIVFGGSGLSSYFDNNISPNFAGVYKGWRQVTDCDPDWTTTEAHPITQYVPETYVFPLTAHSYHMVLFNENQDDSVTLLGRKCSEAPNNYIAAVKKFPGGGTFTWMAFDLGSRTNANSQSEFITPFMRGYLDFIRNGDGGGFAETEETTWETEDDWGEVEVDGAVVRGETIGLENDGDNVNLDGLPDKLYLDFEECSGNTTLDKATNAQKNHGTLHGAVAFRNNDRKFGNCSLFAPTNDHNDRLQLPSGADATDLDQDGPYSMMAWVKPLNSTRTGIINFGSCCNTRNGYTLNYNGGNAIRFWGGADDDNSNYNANGSGVTVNEWNHVGVRVTATQIQVLVNGTVSSTTNVSNVPTKPSATPVNNSLGRNIPNIGGEYIDRGNGGQMLIDEVKIYGRALTDAEWTEAMDNPGITQGFVTEGTVTTEWREFGGADRLLADVSIPEGTAMTVVVQISDDRVNVIDEQEITLENGENLYDLLVANGRFVRLVTTMTGNGDRTPTLNKYTLIRTLQQAWNDADDWNEGTTNGTRVTGNVVTLGREEGEIGEEAPDRLYFDFEECGGDTVNDKASNAQKNNGTIHGSVAFVNNDRKFGNCALRTPPGTENDRLQMPSGADATDLDQTGPYSFMAWIKPLNSTRQGIMNFGSCCNPRNGYTLNYDGSNRLRFWGGADDDTSNYNSYASGVTVNDWNHVGVRVTATQIQVLINGNVSSTTNTSNVPTKPSNVPVNNSLGRNIPNIGGEYIDRGNGGDMLIDEVKVYGRALTDAEWLEAMNNPGIIGDYLASGTFTTEWRRMTGVRFLETVSKIPADTNMVITVQVSNDRNAIVDTQQFILGGGDEGFALDLEDAFYVRLVGQFTTANPEATPELLAYTLFAELPNNGIEEWGPEDWVEGEGDDDINNDGDVVTIVRDGGDPAVMPDRLYFDFEECNGNTVNDKSLNDQKNNGTFQGAARFESNDRKFGNCSMIAPGGSEDTRLQLEGGDAAKDLDQTGPYTYMTWMKRTAGSAKGIIQFGSCCSPRQGYTLSISGSQLRFWGGSDANDSNYNSYADTVPTNQWVHVGARVNATTVQVLIDGVVRRTDNISNIPTSPSQANPNTGGGHGRHNPQLGGRGISYGADATVLIDEVKVFGRYLDDAQYQEAMNNIAEQGDFRDGGVFVTEWRLIENVILLETDASVPPNTTLVAKVQVSNDKNEIIDEVEVEVRDGQVQYPLDIADAIFARVVYTFETNDPNAAPALRGFTLIGENPDNGNQEFDDEDLESGELDNTDIDGGDIVLTQTGALRPDRLYFDFEECEGNDVNDNASNNQKNDATLQGLVRFETEDARIGNCALRAPAGTENDRLQMDGGQDATDLDQEGPYSFMAWIKPLNSTRKGIINLGSCCSPRQGYTLNYNGGSNLRFWGGSDDDNSNYNANASGVVVNEWNHVGVRVTETQVQILINGEVRSTSSISNVPTSPSAVPVNNTLGRNIPNIGGEYIDRGNGGSMLIDEVKVYGRALNDEDWEDAMNNPGGDGEFELTGTYTSEWRWVQGVIGLEADADLPEGTAIVVTVQISNDKEEIIDEQEVVLQPGANTYPLELEEGLFARVVAVLTTNDPNATPRLKSFALLVGDDVQNTPPVVTSPGDQIAQENQVINLAIEASDPDRDALSFSATGLPPGLRIDRDTGVITGTIDEGAAGVYNVTVNVNDGGASATALFGWQVFPPVDPTLTITSPAETWHSEAQTVTATVTDAGCMTEPVIQATNGVTFTVEGEPGAWTLTSDEVGSGRYTPLSVSITSTCSGRTAQATRNFGVDLVAPTLVYVNQVINQQGVSPDDPSTWPAVGQFDELTMVYQARDLASGLATTQVSIRDINNQTATVLHEQAFPTNGTPPTGPTIAPVQGCSNDNHCRDGKLQLGTVEGTNFILRLTATDAAGGTQNLDFYFRSLGLREAIVAWGDAIDELTTEDPLAAGQLERAAAAIELALQGFDNGYMGNITLALQTVQSAVLSVGILDRNVDVSTTEDEADRLGRVFTGVLNNRLQGYIDEQGDRNPTLNTAGEFIETARQAESIGTVLNALANAYFWMEDGNEPFVAENFADTRGVMLRILSEMDAYITNDPELTGAAAIGEARTELSVVLEFIERVVFEGDTTLTDLEHAELLLGLTNTAEFLAEAQLDATWVRNWQWGLTQVVYIYAERGLNNATIFLGITNPVVVEGRADLALANDFRLERRADDFMQLLINSRCLILSIYNFAYNPDIEPPLACCEDMLRYNELDNRFPVHGVCLE